MRAEHEEAFEEFFRATFPATVRTVLLVVGDRPAAEDVAQDAYVRLYVRWPVVSAYENPAGWIRTVAVRLAIKATRRRIPLLGRREGSVAAEERLDIRAGIRRLPPRQRAAVVLHYYEDLPVEEVAQVMGCSRSTVKVHLHRARGSLARDLREEVNDHVAR